MDYLFFIFVFISGLLVGSFLNVVILRLRKKESFIVGRSYCPKCKKELNWYELIPVLSFLLLRGRCSKCRKKISWQYPIVEFAAGLIFLASFFYLFSKIGLGAENIKLFIFNLLFLFFIASILLVIFIYDLKYYIILNKIIYPSVAFVLLANLFNGYYFQNNFLFPSIESSLIGTVAGAAFFFFFVFISKGAWMGMGDVKLAALMGVLLGWEKLICALFLAFISGGIIGLVLVCLKKKKMKSEMPFGTFLAAAAFICLLYGDKIISWYLKYLLCF